MYLFPEMNLPFNNYLSFLRMREKVGMKVVKALKRNDDGVTHAAVDMICALMQVCDIMIYALMQICYIMICALMQVYEHYDLCSDAGLLHYDLCPDAGL